jgi:predicted nucleic acid-binding Zn ribbon protein
MTDLTDDDPDLSPAGRKMSRACRPDWPQGSDGERDSPCMWCARQPPRWHRYAWDAAGPTHARYRWRDYCSNACRQAAYRERKRRKRYELQARNAAMMNNVGLLVSAMMGFPG